MHGGGGCAVSARSNVLHLGTEQTVCVMGFKATLKEYRQAAQNDASLNSRLHMRRWWHENTLNRAEKFLPPSNIVAQRITRVFTVMLVLTIVLHCQTYRGIAQNYVWMYIILDKGNIVLLVYVSYCIFNRILVYSFHM